MLMARLTLMIRITQASTTSKMPAPPATGRVWQRTRKGNLSFRDLTIHSLVSTFRKLLWRIARNLSTILLDMSTLRRFLSWFCPEGWRVSWEREWEISPLYSTSETAKVLTRFLVTSARTTELAKGPWRSRKIWEFVPMHEMAARGEVFCI